MWLQIGTDVPAGTFELGERVMALLSGGGYAEEVRKLSTVSDTSALTCAVPLYEVCVSSGGNTELVKCSCADN